MSGYELWTPAQAVERLAAELPGGTADAEQVVASYLRDATGVHGRPSSGWRMDEFDLDDARARFGWVDFAGGETVAAARTRADAAAVAALREARGTSAITERDRLAGLHTDAEMWGYRAHRVGLDELTNITACDPQPRLVTVAREGRERSHREACTVHDARQAAAEVAAEVAALDEHPREQIHPGDRRAPDQRDEQEAPVDTPDRTPAHDSGHDVVRDVADIGSMLHAEHWSDVIDAVERDENPDTPDRAAAAGSVGSVDGLWFIVDAGVEGGIRPLTETEMRRVADLVRETQADALAVEHDDVPPTGRPSSVDVDGAGWER
ncbi:hypothetical protein FRP1_16605 [Pseudonocardia sp. EC080625-04]|uniref:hypothetical protein n=1 Tax=Pseudonocardia sp. EC080625-04 TaxID=1096868 RepID=UPI0006CB5185|nr:hypothetical protein [Pseudonocardia sp. EC080625-04]ALE74222.1 hypothetical protein FRP1_16605 [Pseudonocardia sp. EC080625-04]